jgi:transcriptional repressor NrdR
MVAKRSGVTEPFNRDKIVRGVRRACQGRPVTEDQLAILAQRVEDAIRSRGSGEVPSHEVGLAILGPLRDLDEVAYLRFASVYRGFESLADFEEEIAGLRREHDRDWRPGNEDGARPPAGKPPEAAGRPSEPAGELPEQAGRRPPASREPADTEQRAGAR